MPEPLFNDDDDDNHGSQPDAEDAPPLLRVVGCSKTPAQLRTLFLAVLTPDETSVVAFAVFNDMTHVEIGDHFGRCRQWASRKLHRALRKLAANGVYLSVATKGRRPRGSVPLRYVDPAALSQLRVDEAEAPDSDTGFNPHGAERLMGQVRGTWNPSRKRRRKRIVDTENERRF